MESIQWRVVMLDETDSTNNYLDRIDTADEQPEGCVVATHTQSAGRGQRGNSWEAEPGRNLTFSLLLRPHTIPPQEQFRLSQAVSLAMTDVLSRYAEGFSVKWPNDIYYRDNKIAGILIEHNLAGTNIARTIVGVGLNVNQQHFLSDAPNPISLTHITGKQHNLQELLQELLQTLTVRYTMCIEDCDTLQSDYLAQLYRRDGFYPYRDVEGLFEAAIETVLPGGFLVLRDRDGVRREYAFKEVAFIL